VGNFDRLTDWPIATRPAVEHGNGQKHFFHLLDMAILNSYILLLSGSEKKISQKGFRLALVREMLARAGHKPRPSMSVRRPAFASAKLGRLNAHYKHQAAM
jgi:hypothetical protein